MSGRPAPTLDIFSKNARRETDPVNRLSRNSALMFCSLPAQPRKSHASVTPVSGRVKARAPPAAGIPNRGKSSPRPSRRSARELLQWGVPIRMIAMDIDGTLLNSSTLLPEENLQAILEAAGRGIEILLVTGRRFDFARTVSDLIPCELHLIVNNGALIKSKSGETHQRLLLPAEVARQVVDALPHYRAEAAVV